MNSSSLIQRCQHIARRSGTGGATWFFLAFFEHVFFSRKGGLSWSISREHTRNYFGGLRTSIFRLWQLYRRIATRSANSPSIVGSCLKPCSQPPHRTCFDWASAGDGAFQMTEWSFGQLCRLAGLPKQTVNRLSPDTAKRVFYETLPIGEKPLQLLLRDRHVRSIHAASYTRLYSADLLDLVQECAPDFCPPQKAGTGGTGLYCGEQDMFCFLIDPGGWVEIDGQAFAPGFFVWNSEVGRRTVGIETFWYQSICANHVVWDAVETVEFARKHTTNVRESLSDIRRILCSLIAKRDERRDTFVQAVSRAMHEKLRRRRGLGHRRAAEARDSAEHRETGHGDCPGTRALHSVRCRRRADTTGAR